MASYLSWIELCGLATGLGTHAFAVAAAASEVLPCITFRRVFRLAFHFGMFRSLIAVLGWMVGQLFVTTSRAADHWVAFGLVGILGGWMIWKSRGPAELRADKDPSRGLTMVRLSVANSLDAFPVGLSLTLLDLSIWTPAVVIGLVAAALSTAGIFLRARAGKSVRGAVQLAGGLILILIGLLILVEHTFLARA